jgi:hypothetical protein
VVFGSSAPPGSSRHHEQPARVRLALGSLYLTAPLTSSSVLQVTLIVLVALGTANATTFRAVEDGNRLRFRISEDNAGVTARPRLRVSATYMYERE